MLNRVPGIYIVTDIQTGKKIEFTPNIPRWIQKWGFYEGFETKYHVDPLKIIDFFGIKADKEKSSISLDPHEELPTYLRDTIQKEQWEYVHVYRKEYNFSEILREIPVQLHNKLEALGYITDHMTEEKLAKDNHRVMILYDGTRKVLVLGMHIDDNTFQTEYIIKCPPKEHFLEHEAEIYTFDKENDKPQIVRNTMTGFTTINHLHSGTIALWKWDSHY